MSTEFSLSRDNIHYNKKTPQGLMLSEILNVTGSTENVWYADTFSIPTFRNLEQYYKGMGTVILYCWWDPADNRILKYLDAMELDFIVITSDPDILAKHPRIKTIKWQYQFGFHFDLIKNSAPTTSCNTGTFLCMMRNHKPERLLFLEALWRSGLLDNNLVSYLGQVNTKAIHGRTPRLIEEIISEIYQADTDFTYKPSNDFAEWLVNNIPILLQGDNTQTSDNNTDFFTCGNPNWYLNTQYSVVLETYWANTEFLTEKSFKPIVAGHPFVNLGNNSNALLKSLGFDVFEDVFGSEHDSLSASDKIASIIPKLTTVDIDPTRCLNNQRVGADLLEMAKLEQKQLADHVLNLL